MASEISSEVTARLDQLFHRLDDYRSTFVGYPCTADLDYSELFRFLQFPVNNVGDPYKDGTYQLHTHDFEREVIDWFAELCHAPKDSYWGYVTNGGTEGNMYGLYLAREMHPDGIVYYGQDTHYSVSKMLRVLKMRSIMIKSQPNGQMDCEDLRSSLNYQRHQTPIIFANIGTTMREAVDDIPKIQSLLADLAIPSSYIHCDAALSGMTLPFMEDAPHFDFRNKVDSISISGHKFIGAPIPCGIVLANKHHVQRIARSIEYVGTLDTTITGSRNAITPLMLWYSIHKWGREGFAQRVKQCLENAEYAVQKLQEYGVEAWRNPWAITVVFPRPTPEITEKWQIAVQDEIGHMLVMPHIDKTLIDTFVKEFAASKHDEDHGKKDKEAA